MSGAIDHMDLQCKHCDCRWPPDAVVEAVLLHFQVEHDTDDVTLDLRAICECGAAMTLTDTVSLGIDKVRDNFTCSACGKRGALKRSK